MTAITDNNTLMRIAMEGIGVEAQAVATMAGQVDDTLLEVAELIDSKPGKVFVTGGGTSGMTAHRMAHLLAVSGTPAVYIHAMDAMHGSMGGIEPDDVVISLSKGGESDEINELCRLLKAKGTALVGVGERPESTHAGIVDIYVALHTIDGADPFGRLAMGSTLVAGAWGDALARVLMCRHDWTEDQSLKLHPAGAVGKYAKSKHIF